MREINVNELKPILAELCQEANYFIGEDLLEKLEQFRTNESSPLGQSILDDLLENYKIAAKEKLPVCQDTGLALVFLEIGQDIHFTGGNLIKAINAAISLGYTEGFLRKSVVDDPLFERKNTGDNTPAIIYQDIVPGDKLKITFVPKGGGSENMSKIAMLKPADGVEGVIDFVLKTVTEAGGNPCPPIVVGVGVGGSFEKAAYLAKKSLLRRLDENNPDPKWAELEETLLTKINNTGIGPQGLGGLTTALAVHILHHPCHIASLPVAVNIQCHAYRHKEVVI